MLTQALAEGTDLESYPLGKATHAVRSPSQAVTQHSERQFRNTSQRTQGLVIQVRLKVIAQVIHQSMKLLPKLPATGCQRFESLLIDSKRMMNSQSNRTDAMLIILAH